MPFFWITTTFIVGIIVATLTRMMTAGWLIILILLAGIAVFITWGYSSFWPNRHLPAWISCRLPRTKLPIVFLPAILALGGLTCVLNQPRLGNSIYSAQQNGSYVQAVGRVADLPDKREKLILVKINVNKFNIEGGPDFRTNETVLVYLPVSSTLKYGDTVTFSGKPVTPSETEDFSYKEYLAGQEIFSLFYYPRIIQTQPQGRPDFYGLLLSFKTRSLALLDQIFPSPESALAKGILLGDDNDIPADLQDAFRNSGTSHLIAISGFNVSIVAGLFILLFGKVLGKYRGILFSILAIILYTILVGSGPSVVRAAIMGIISMLGILIGRRSGGVNALFLTSGVMLLFNPFLLWSVSFQLSVAATLGLVLYAGFLQDRTISLFTRFFPENLASRIGSVISEYFLFTLAAQFTTFPLLLAHFHRMPWSTFVSNPLALPAQPPLMVSAGAALFLAWISPALGKFAGLISLPFFTYTIRIVEWAGSLLWPNIVWNQMPVAIGGLWLCGLSFLAAVPDIKLKLPSYIKPAVLMGVSAVLAYCLIHTAVDRPDGRLSITFMGGESAEAIFIRTPSGNQILLNGGSSSNRLSNFIDPRLMFFHRSLDGIFILPGKSRAEVLPEFLNLVPAKQIFWVGPADNSPTYSALLESQPSIRSLSSGDTISLGDGILLRIVSDNSPNNTIALSYGDLTSKFIFGLASGEFPCGSNVLYLEKDQPLDEKCLPQVTIVHKASPLSNSISLDQHKWVKFYSDGHKLWLEGQ
jgi:competence protein ComEC